MGSFGASVWKTPFTFASFPSVGMVMEPDGDRTALLVVAPGGLGAYPKYVVRFSHVFAVTCSEEAGFVLDLGQELSSRESIAHVWHASPHVAGYAATALAADLALRHYVVFGGDNIASIVCGAAPTIETVTDPLETKVRYAV